MEDVIIYQDSPHDWHCGPASVAMQRPPADIRKRCSTLAAFFMRWIMDRGRKSIFSCVTLETSRNWPQLHLGSARSPRPCGTSK
jgi:hypothetical protein